MGEVNRIERIKGSAVFSHARVALFRKNAAAVYLGASGVKPLKPYITAQAGHVTI